MVAGTCRAGWGMWGTATRQRWQAWKEPACLSFLLFSLRSKARKVPPRAEEGWGCILPLSLQLSPQAAHTRRELRHDGVALPLIQRNNRHSGHFWWGPRADKKTKRPTQSSKSGSSGTESQCRGERRRQRDICYKRDAMMVKEGSRRSETDEELGETSNDWQKHSGVGWEKAWDEREL